MGDFRGRRSLFFPFYSPFLFTFCTFDPFPASLLLFNLQMKVKVDLV